MYEINIFYQNFHQKDISAISLLDSNDTDSSNHSEKGSKFKRKLNEKKQNSSGIKNIVSLTVSWF